MRPGANVGGLKLTPMSWHLIYTLIKQVDMCGESLEARRDLLGEILTDLIARKNKLLKDKPDSKEYSELAERLVIAKDDFDILINMYNPKLDHMESYHQSRADYTQAYFCLLLECKSIIEEYTILDKEAFNVIPLPGAAYNRIQEELSNND